MMDYPLPPQDIYKVLRKGVVIPAHPLALTSQRKFDEKYQRALTRYYLTAGVGGLAVGVHTTQFEIRQPKIGLLRPVLQLASETINSYEKKYISAHIIRIAGICGKTKQAVVEATLARELGYHIGLLSLGAMKQESAQQLIDHARAVANIIPLMGFYLQPSVGGRILDFDFWTKFCEIPNMVAIKIAPFNRYQTIDVMRAVAETGRVDDVALYTGNDDAIIADLFMKYRFKVSPKKHARVQFVGGLLGHWAVWTKKACELLGEIQRLRKSHTPATAQLLSLAFEITDSNAAFFDPAHQFAGCIAGIHEVLRRQGLMQGRWCLNPNEELSPGQMEEIDRVYAAYPHLNDDQFVAENLDTWLR
ncbi:MAG: dihydrodipicolinate synthase family protein [Candidatus Omnitrophota bacterium]|jgi:dihydrodipicolinate synthase/N-acetylneuraminate lyase|nr:MAG: dihydrodipicolinate synthase family protein [Candidatus Omnitrophota bacterium]